jgi:hypothetical protein
MKDRIMNRQRKKVLFEAQVRVEELAREGKTAFAGRGRPARSAAGSLPDAVDLKLLPAGKRRRLPIGCWALCPAQPLLIAHGTDR